MLHRTCDLGPIRAVTADISAHPTGCEAQFRLDGRVGDIVLPDPGPSVRTDDLWKTTCFEIFWQPIGSRDAPIDAISLDCEVTGEAGQEQLVLSAVIAADLPTPAQVALNAIVEHRGGALQFWALAFGPGKPEFHSEACRQLIVDL